MFRDEEQIRGRILFPPLHVSMPQFGYLLLPENLADATLPKFKPDGILVVHCGGGAGLFSTMIGGWIGGEIGSQPVLREIGT